jgi:hypothetical protein
MLLSQRFVHRLSRFLAQRCQLAWQALALCFVLDDEPAIARPPAIVGEPEKGEGFRTPLATLPSSQGRETAELDQSRLVLVKRQPEPGKAL